MKKIARWIYYMLAIIFSKTVCVIPYGISVKAGGLLGLAAYFVIGAARRETIKNLQASFPEKGPAEIRQIAKKVFINQGKNLFELLLFPKIDGEKLKRIVTLRDASSLKDAFGRGRGVLILTGHIGNWEILGAALAQAGFPINVIAKKIYIEGLNNMVVGLRESKKVKVILRSSKESARNILKALKKNESIGMLIDQDTSVPGVFVDFFSRKAWTPSGLAAIAARTGAAVVTAFDVRQEDDTHIGLLSGPIEIKVSKNAEKDIVENTQAMTAIIESHIRKFPEQWVWMHQRWKTRPASSSDGAVN